MDEFYAWQKKRRKKYLRIFAAALCLCVVFVTYPDILASLSVLAEGEEDNTIYLSGFCGLPEDVRNQTVLLGTGIDELALPDTLEAVTYVYESSDEEPGEGESKEEDGEPDGSDDGEYDGSEQGDGEDGEAPGEDSGEAEVSPGETEGDGTSGEGSGEENDGSGEGDAEGDDGSDGDSSDSAGEDSGEDSEGEGSGDGGGESGDSGDGSDGVSGDSGDSGDGEGADSGESSDSADDSSEGSGDSGEDSDEDSDSGNEGSADADEPESAGEQQETYTVSMAKYQSENEVEVHTLTEDTGKKESGEEEPTIEENSQESTVTKDNGTDNIGTDGLDGEDAETEDVPEEDIRKEEIITVEGITWESAPAYDSQAEGAYVFTPILPGGYELSGGGITLPEITVTVIAGMQPGEPVVSGWHFKEDDISPKGELIYEDGMYNVALAGGEREVQIPFDDITSLFPESVVLELMYPQAEAYGAGNDAGSSAGSGDYTTDSADSVTGSDVNDKGSTGSYADGSDTDDSYGAGSAESAGTQGAGMPQELELPVTGWSCPEYKEDKEGYLPYGGSFFFRAQIGTDSDGKSYALEEGMEPVGVLVIFDEPMTMADDGILPKEVTADMTCGAQDIRGTYTIHPGVTVTLTGPLNANYRTTIKGGGKIVRADSFTGTEGDAKGSAMIVVDYYIGTSSSDSLTIQGITLDGRNVGAYGPILYVQQGNLTATDSIIQNGNNISQSARGGGIYCTDTFSDNGYPRSTYVYLREGTLIKNCSANPGAGGEGGGIYVYSKNCSIFDSVIQGNKASVGGGIYNAKETIVQNSIVTGNIAGTGSEIYDSDTNNLDIRGTFRSAGEIYLKKSSQKRYMKYQHLNGGSLPSITVCTSLQDDEKEGECILYTYDTNGFTEEEKEQVIVQDADGYVTVLTEKNKKICLSKVYQVQYENMGTGGTIEDADNYKSYVSLQGLALPPADKVTRQGYIFDGWYADDKFTGSAVTSIPAKSSGDKTYYAKWTPLTCTVTYAYEGATGNNTTKSETVTYDSVYGTLPSPTKTGFSFQGWYTAQTGGTKVESGTKVDSYTNHTLYARWKDSAKPGQPTLQNGETLPAGWTKTKSDIPLTLKDNVGVTQLWVKKDSGTYQQVSGFPGGASGTAQNYSYTYTDTDTEGSHTYIFKTKDAVGNESVDSAVFTLKYDKTPPEINNVSYSAGHKTLQGWEIGKPGMTATISPTDKPAGGNSGADVITYTVTPQGGAPETKTAAVSGGKATITFGSEFKGTVSVTCTDKAGNQSAAKMLGASGGGVLVESHAPQVGFTVNGGAVSDAYYETSPAVKVGVDDGADGVLSGGIAEVKYKVGNGGTEKGDGQNYTSGIVEKSSFTIPASEIPTGMTQITVKATDNAGNMKTAYVTVKVKGPEAVPNAGLDKTSESLTGLTPDKEYKVSYTDTDGTKKSTTVKTDGDGKLKLEEAWVDKTVEIVKLGNGTDSTDSSPQSFTIPPRQNTPTGITAEGETGWAKKDGKIVGLTVGTDYEISAGGASWQDVTADAEGEIKNLAPGNYQVRVKADSATIASKPVTCRVAAYVCGHVWDAGKVTKEATEKTPGIRTYTCTICKVTRQETIPAKGGSQNSGGGKDDDKKDENKNDNSGDNGTGGQGSGIGGADGNGTDGNGTGGQGSGIGGADGSGTGGNGTGGQGSGIDGTDGNGTGTGSNSGGADGAGTGTDGTDKKGTGSDVGSVVAGSINKVVDMWKDVIGTVIGIYENIIGSIADGGSGYMIEGEIASVDMQKIMTAIGGAQVLNGSGKTAAGSEQSAYGSGEAAVGSPQSVYGPDEDAQAGTQSVYDSGKGAAEGTMPTGGASEDTQGGVQTSPGFGKEEGKCSLCHVCPTFFGCCYFAWGAVVGLAVAISFIFHRRWRRNRYKNET